VVIFFSCVGLGLVFLGLAAVGRQIIHRIRVN
jgi:hypothetical protein